MKTVHTKVYSYEGHTITHKDPFNPVCETCSLSFTIARAVEFMSQNEIRSLTVDGVTIKFSHVM